MSDLSDTDGMLQEWGTRLFYPMPRPKKAPDHKVFVTIARATAAKPVSADKVRQMVRSTTRRAPQVVVKISPGKNHGMKSVAAHMRYISRLGKDEVGGKGNTLELEDQNGNKISGKDDLKDLMADWQTGGSFIPDESHRREAFNIILSMPAGTPPEHVLNSARDFAKETFQGHAYVFVMHDDTDSPHVHLMVRAERNNGVRLNPRKADLATWRARFAARLQDRGVSAASTWGAARGVRRAGQSIWRVKTVQGRQRSLRPAEKGGQADASHDQALAAWATLVQVLAASTRASDRELAKDAERYAGEVFGKGVSLPVQSGRPDPQQGGKPPPWTLRGRGHQDRDGGLGR